MIREYICTFKSKQHTDTLIFDIHRNPISEQWSELVEHHISIGNNLPKGIQNGFLGNAESLSKKIVELCNNIGLDVPHKLNQSSLNDLHARFHFAEERNTTGNKQEQYKQLNTAIHRLEDLQKNPKQKHYTWHIQNDSGPYIEITDDYWKYYSIKICKYHRPHGLYIGYHTIGKDILSTFKDRDIELVKVNGVRQPKYFSTETIYKSDRGLQINKTSEIKKWLRNNDCLHLIDFNLPKYKHYQTLPRIGTLRTNKSSDEIKNLFANYTMSKVDIA